MGICSATCYNVTHNIRQQPNITPKCMPRLGLLPFSHPPPPLLSIYHIIQFAYKININLSTSIAIASMSEANCKYYVPENLYILVLGPSTEPKSHNGQQQHSTA